ncbi:MAG: O-antigen ligase family protein [Proteobacteria bacterium]|nr:O-antigen ligase family protein [Pseudomonadota bacterium]
MLGRLMGSAEQGAARLLSRRRLAAAGWPLLFALAFVTIVAVVVRIPLWGHAYTASDTTHYLQVARGIFHGGFIDNLRPPGYSFLLACFELVGLNPVRGVVGLQNLIGMTLPAAVVLLGRRYFNLPTALAAGFLTAASPLMIMTEQFALADYLFGVLLLAATVSLAEATIRLRAEGRGSTRFLIAAGAFFGLAALFRANGVLAVVAIPAAIALGSWGHWRWRRVLKHVATAGAAMALVLAPWIVHNVFAFGDTSIATEGGISLYARAISYDNVAPGEESADSRLARRIYDTSDFTELRGELQRTVGVYNALVRTGKDPSEASAAMGAIAKAAILREPLTYLENTWTILGLYRQLYDPKTFTANHFVDQIITARNYFRTLAPHASVIPGDSSMTRAPWQVAQTLTKIIYLLTLGGALILLLPFFGRPQARIAAAVLMIVALLGFFGGSLTAVFSPRYDIMFAPFVWILGSAAVVLLLQFVAVALRPARPQVLAAAGAAGSFVARRRRLVRRPAIRPIPRPDLRARFSRLTGAVAAGSRRARDAARISYRPAGRALVAVAFLAPFSATHIAGPLTVGRAAAIVLAALLALAVLAARPTDLRFGTPAFLAGGAYLGLFFWILISAGTWGCNCEGKLGGFAEFAFVGLLALATIGFTPKIRERVLLAVLAGLGLAAVFALVGVGAINSGTVDLTQTGGRLSGTYGNANELGFAMALGVPIAATYAFATRGRARMLFAASLAVLGAALVLSYSRGAIIAAGVALVAIALLRATGSRRRQVAILGAATAVALLALALYPVFEHARQSASFRAVPVAFRPLDQRDLTGWDSRAGGPVPAGPSRLRNSPAGIVVSTDRVGEGASYGWGEAAAHGRYELSVRLHAKASGRLPISLSLGDAVRDGGPRRTFLVGRRARTVTLPWTPRARAPHARLYVWQRSGDPAAFVLDSVRVHARAPGHAEEVIEVPDKLRGSLYRHMVASVERGEADYVDSRVEAAKLAAEAFASSPLHGIGWATFPRYAEEHLKFGQLAAHDEYLSFAAELGLIGLLPLGLLIGAVILGIRGAGRRTVETAAIGAVCAAAVGLAFVEALPVPQLSVPLALVVAVLCARGGGVERAEETA